MIKNLDFPLNFEKKKYEKIYISRSKKEVKNNLEMI